MSQGNQSIDFNGKYQYLLIIKWSNKEQIIGVYDNLKSLKLGINQSSSGYTYTVTKIFVKSENINMMQEEIDEIKEYAKNKRRYVEITT